MSIPTPSTIGYGRIRGQFIQGIKDGDDVDDIPDLIAATGTITFTPEVSGGITYTGNAGLVVIPRTIMVTLDDDGNIDEKFIATDRGNPINWTYRVDFAISGLIIPSISISMPAGSDRLMSEWVPVSTSTGEVTTQGPAGPQGPPGEGIDMDQFGNLKMHGFVIIDSSDDPTGYGLYNEGPDDIVIYGPDNDILVLNSVVAVFRSNVQIDRQLTVSEVLSIQGDGANTMLQLYNTDTGNAANLTFRDDNYLFQEAGNLGLNGNFYVGSASDHRGIASFRSDGSVPAIRVHNTETNQYVDLVLGDDGNFYVSRTVIFNGNAIFEHGVQVYENFAVGGPTDFYNGVHFRDTTQFDKLMTLFGDASTPMIRIHNTDTNQNMDITLADDGFLYFNGTRVAFVQDVVFQGAAAHNGQAVFNAGMVSNSGFDGTSVTLHGNGDSPLFFLHNTDTGHVAGFTFRDDDYVTLNRPFAVEQPLYVGGVTTFAQKGIFLGDGSGAQLVFQHTETGHLAGFTFRDDDWIMLDRKLTVEGDFNVNGKAWVNQEFRASAGMIVNGGISVSPNVTIGGTGDTPSVILINIDTNHTAEITFRDDDWVQISRNLTTDGSLAVAGSTTVNGFRAYAPSVFEDTLTLHGSGETSMLTLSNTNGGLVTLQLSDDGVTRFSGHFAVGSDLYVNSTAHITTDGSKAHLTLHNSDTGHQVDITFADDDNLYFSKTVIVQGNAIIQGGMIVNGDVTTNAGVNMHGGALVESNGAVPAFRIQNSTTAHYVDMTFANDDNLYLTRGVVIQGNAYVTGVLTVQGSMHMIGPSAFDDTASFHGNVQFDNRPRIGLQDVATVEDVYYRTNVRDLPSNDAYLAGTGVYKVDSLTANLNGLDFLMRLDDGAMLVSANPGAGVNGTQTVTGISAVGDSVIYFRVWSVDDNAWTAWALPGGYVANKTPVMESVQSYGTLTYQRVANLITIRLEWTGGSVPSINLAEFGFGDGFHIAKTGLHLFINNGVSDIFYIDSENSFGLYCDNNFTNGTTIDFTYLTNDPFPVPADQPGSQTSF